MGDPNAPVPDATHIFDVLSRHNVNFILVGGYAGIAHGASRVTRDVDVVPQNTDDNLERLATALKELNAGARVEGLDEPIPRPIDAYVLRNELTTWRTDAGDIEVILWLPADNKQTLPYELLKDDAEQFQIGNGTAVLVASLDHIIESKIAIGREPDLVALPELRDLQSRQQREAQRRQPPKRGLDF